MKDEIKLKDMTDFLENVYKDIKKQPTLEEELEKERKFINKIKGDNKDEIKEINIPENVLIALGDLTNGALNYYKATETVKVRHNTILDYITNLQEENERLNDTMAKIKDLNTMTYLRDDIFKEQLNYILKGE